MWGALNRLRRLFNSSLFCRDVRSTVRCSAETFVQQFVILLRRSIAEFTCASPVSTPSSTPASRSSLVIWGALLRDILRRLPRGPLSSSKALYPRTFFDVFLEF